MMYENILIDSRNAIYRALYAGLADQQFRQMGFDYAVIFFRFIASNLQRFKPRSTHFFWDSPKETIWRRKVYAEYKNGREHSATERYPDVDFEHLLSRTTEICMKIVESVGGKNYQLPRQEADDLIYAFCRKSCHQKNIIISSDSDFRQIPFTLRNVDLFNPLGKTNDIYKLDELDPTELKCFTGENGDNIKGYYKIGPVRAAQLIVDAKKRIEFFNVHGNETYVRNRALIDLSLCPFLLQNMIYIDEVRSKDTSFDIGKVREIIQKYKVKGLLGEVNKIILPFKFLGVKAEATNGNSSDSLR